jgi:hypothetical protein
MDSKLSRQSDKLGRILVKIILFGALFYVALETQAYTGKKISDIPLTAIAILAPTEIYERPETFLGSPTPLTLYLRRVHQNENGYLWGHPLPNRVRWKTRPTGVIMITTEDDGSEKEVLGQITPLRAGKTKIFAEYFDPEIQGWREAGQIEFQVRERSRPSKEDNDLFKETLSKLNKVLRVQRLRSYSGELELKTSLESQDGEICSVGVNKRALASDGKVVESYSSFTLFPIADLSPFFIPLDINRYSRKPYDGCLNADTGRCIVNLRPQSVGESIFLVYNPGLSQPISAYSVHLEFSASSKKEVFGLLSQLNYLIKFCRENITVVDL